MEKERPVEKVRKRSLYLSFYPVSPLSQAVRTDRTGAGWVGGLAWERVHGYQLSFEICLENEMGERKQIKVAKPS